MIGRMLAKLGGLRQVSPSVESVSSTGQLATNAETLVLALAGSGWLWTTLD